MELNPPLYNAFIAVVPDDFRSLKILGHYTAWGLFIGVGGDVRAVGSDGNTATFKNVPSGTVLPIHVVQVNLTGTTATNIVALYSVVRP